MPCAAIPLVCPFCRLARRNDAPPQFFAPDSCTPNGAESPEPAPRRLPPSAPFGGARPEGSKVTKLPTVCTTNRGCQETRKVWWRMASFLSGAKNPPPGATAAAPRPELESNLSAVPVSPKTSCGAGLQPASFEKPARRTREVVSLGARRWLYRHVAPLCFGNAKAERRSLHNAPRHVLPA